MERTPKQACRPNLPPALITRIPRAMWTTILAWHLRLGRPFHWQPHRRRYIVSQPCQTHRAADPFSKHRHYRLAPSSRPDLHSVSYSVPVPK